MNYQQMCTYFCRIELGSNKTEFETEKEPRTPKNSSLGAQELDPEIEYQTT